MGSATQSEKPKFMPIGVRAGVENGDEEVEDAEDVELMLSVRRNDARATGFKESAANCATGGDT